MYGSICGIVTIRYEDGNVYEGPYVEESFVDSYGVIDASGRSLDHYGYFTCKDGRVFEGEQVDNHFSPLDVTGILKLTVPGQFIYDGEWCDQRMHGVGTCVYSSGDVYEGDWHQNARFGSGRYRSAEGWVYEGAFNNNQRHGDGSICWDDGGFYLGSWSRDKRSGKGVMLTRILDLYQGEFKDDHLEGWGQMFYSNGSSYTGFFANSMRHGKGKLTDRDGTEYHGEYVLDKRQGDFVVKCILPTVTTDVHPVEIRIGTFKEGSLMEWKRVINKAQTDDFIDLFYSRGGSFDSVYSMLLAKGLPKIPAGLDPDNKEVQNILERIRKEGGQLVSSIPLQQALAKVKEILLPIR
jgi:hypothetical protein